MRRVQNVQKNTEQSSPVSRSKNQRTCRSLLFLIVPFAVCCYTVVQTALVSRIARMVAGSRTTTTKPIKHHETSPSNHGTTKRRDKKNRTKSIATSSRVSSSEKDDKPAIVWLASYPNSGTSYTMTLVERGSNLSTASNYGAEVTPDKGADSLPLHPNHPEGPYWEGLENAALMKHTVRELPDEYVLTKTHCGGRCIKCPATEYVVQNVTEYAQACQRTTSIDAAGHHTEHLMDPSRVKRLVHLIRNPMDNTVSRFHLERRHFVEKDAAYYSERYPYNATGFQQWCKDLDDKYSSAERIAIRDEKIRKLMKGIPCRAEFFKFAQWHNMLLETVPLLGDPKDTIPVLTIHYEKYETDFEKTSSKLFKFLKQKPVAPLRPFRALPDYSDHYTDAQRIAIHDLVKAASSRTTWDLVHHYFDGHTLSSTDGSKKTVEMKTSKDKKMKIDNKHRSYHTDKEEEDPNSAAENQQPLITQETAERQRNLLQARRENHVRYGNENRGTKHTKVIRTEK